MSEIFHSSPEEELQERLRLPNPLNDVLAKTDDGRICHVEVQLSDEGNFVERVVYYAACSLEDQLSTSQDYSELRPVIFVSLLRFNLFKDKPESWHSTQRLLDVENHKCYSDCLEFHFLELPKLARMRRKLEETSLIRLLCYLGRIGGVMEMERLAEKDPGIARLRKDERAFFRTPGNLALYMKRERAETDYQNALKKREAKGEAKGRAEGKAETARSLLEMGLAPEKIALATGLSLAEVEALRP